MKIKNIIFSGLFCCKSENLNETPNDAAQIDGRDKIYNEYIKIIDKDFEIPKKKNLENLLDFYNEEIKNINYINLHYIVSDLIVKEEEKEEKKKISFKLKEKQRKLIEILLKEIENLNLKKNTNNENTKKKIFVGNISSGKSSLINCLFNTNEKTGKGGTTNKIKEVYSNNKIIIYDSQGFHNDLTLDLDTLKNIYNFDQVYILHACGIFNELVIKIISKIFRPKDIFLVITKCDNSSSEEEEEDITEYVKKCTKDLKRLGIDIKEEQIFLTNAKTGGFDNEKLKESLLS